MSFKLPRITKSISNITEATNYMSEVHTLREDIQKLYGQEGYDDACRTLHVAEEILQRLLEKAEH